MGIYSSDPNKDNDDFAVDPEVTSAFASYEAALREVLETGPENISEKRKLRKGDGEEHKPRLDLGRFRRILVVLLGLIVVLALAWAVGMGPLSPYMRQMIAQLNERANEPFKTETPLPSETATAEVTQSPDQTALTGLPLASPTATSSPTLAPSPTPEATANPTNTETPTPEPTATSSVAGCVPAASITLDDVGKELCVTAFVFSAEVFETYFAVRTGEDFYYVSYAKGWYKDYGVTWEFKKGDCVFATGKIEQIGSYPLMQVGYKNPLKLCEEP